MFCISFYYWTEESFSDLKFSSLSCWFFLKPFVYLAVIWALHCIMRCIGSLAVAHRLSSCSTWALGGMWNLSSPTRDWTQPLGVCIESTESYPQDHQEVPLSGGGVVFFSFLIIGLAYGLCCSLRVLNCNSTLFPYKPIFAGKITVLFLRSTEVLGLCSQNSPMRPAWFTPFYSEA